MSWRSGAQPFQRQLRTRPMQQLYAVIKARSKYTSQQPRAFGNDLPKAGRAIPFPVTFRKDVGGYCVFGNDNTYRLEDCNFFVHVNDGSDYPYVELVR